MRRAAIAAVALLLTGCAPTLQERIEQRDECHKAGGEWHEWSDGWADQRGACDLSDNANGDV